MLLDELLSRFLRVKSSPSVQAARHSTTDNPTCRPPGKAVVCEFEILSPTFPAAWGLIFVVDPVSPVALVPPKWERKMFGCKGVLSEVMLQSHASSSLPSDVIRLKTPWLPKLW